MGKFGTVSDAVLHTLKTTIVDPCGVVPPELCGVPNANPTMFLTTTWPGPEITRVIFGCTWSNGETKEMYSTNYELSAGGGGANPTTSNNIENWTIDTGAGGWGMGHLKLQHNRYHRGPYIPTFTTFTYPSVNSAQQRIEFAKGGWFSGKTLDKYGGSPTYTNTQYQIGTIPAAISLQGGARTGALTLNQTRLGAAMFTGQGNTSLGLGAAAPITHVSWTQGNGW